MQLFLGREKTFFHVFALNCAFCIRIFFLQLHVPRGLLATSAFQIEFATTRTIHVILLPRIKVIQGALRNGCKNAMCTEALLQLFKVRSTAVGNQIKSERDF
jgi:hypothetical protein